MSIALSLSNVIMCSSYCQGISPGIGSAQILPARINKQNNLLYQNNNVFRYFRGMYKSGLVYETSICLWPKNRQCLLSYIGPNATLLIQIDDKKIHPSSSTVGRIEGLDIDKRYLIVIKQDNKTSLLLDEFSRPKK